MIGFTTSRKLNDVNRTVQQAVDYADTYNFLQPEQTTYRLRHAMFQVGKPVDVISSIQLSDLIHRGSNLSSELRARELDHNQAANWLHNNLHSIGTAKTHLKNTLRQPWNEHYDWLGQSLAHSDILSNRTARRGYEQLAITYRIQQHLLNLESNQFDAETTNSGYRIEQAMHISDRITSKANRLIDHYYRPVIT